MKEARIAMSKNPIATHDSASQPHVTQLKAGWSRWGPLGGNLVSGPTIAFGNGRIDVFGRVQDNSVHHLKYTGTGGWETWEPIGGNLSSDPDACWNSAGTELQIVGRDDQGNVTHNWYT